MGETMIIQHKDLADGRWARMPFYEQMANIGSEVSRALNWRKKNNTEMSQKAVVRALELLDLSLGCASPYPKIKELARLREALVDYFYGSNEFSSSELLWRNYFDHFAYLSRRRR